MLNKWLFLVTSIIAVTQTKKWKIADRLRIGEVEDGVKIQAVVIFHVPHRSSYSCSEVVKIEAGVVHNPPSDKSDFCSFTGKLFMCRRRKFLLNDEEWLTKTLDEYRKKKMKWEERKLVRCIWSMLLILEIPPIPGSASETLKKSTAVVDLVLKPQQRYHESHKDRNKTDISTLVLFIILVPLVAIQIVLIFFLILTIRCYKRACRPATPRSAASGTKVRKKAKKSAGEGSKNKRK
ncbi:hypothetical protein ANCCAN_06594 [Ancylostoma caninum]|uniref:Uncharacterized protein n=1 Tax=Ancylostoma caninum TaxID=29170 RepID=A0A368GSF1_ANCCA|nr:hypothetical protein ANCCAN_06594 [Ancylostoma caninum]